MTHGDTPIVDKISFEIRRGQVLGLVGESGSGKTTAGLALMGYTRRGLSITDGSVHVGNCNILSLTPKQRQKVRGRIVAYVPQDPASALNPSVRVGAQLREVFEAHPDSLPTGVDVHRRLQELCDDVRLPNADRVLRSYPHQLSGGQQQRVGIAMAFAARPELIIFDEPTTGLDVSTQRHFLDTVRRLANETGVAALYVSHDLPAVAEIADQVAVMYSGRVIEYGDAANVFGDPQHPYTASLLDAVPSTRKTIALVGTAGQPPNPGESPDGRTSAERCSVVGDEYLSTVAELTPSVGNLLGCDDPGTVDPPVGATVASASTAIPTESALVCHDLNARYGSRDVLRGVNFELEAGKCLAVVGESGSGKTTLARCLIGLHENWSGHVAFGGDPLHRHCRKRTQLQRRAMQYVFQSPYNSLNPRKTVGEILEAPLKVFFDYNRSDRLARILGTLSAVSLTPTFLNKFPSQLSGGERQRVSLGRSLILEPSLMICDEITSALDVSVQASIVEELRAIQKNRNLSLLFITHDLAVVRSIAQAVIVLDGGVIVENGRTADVLDNPVHAYTRQLLTNMPRMRAIA
jgi:peptide/nickel transport system ATP-binding protein